MKCTTIGQSDVFVGIYELAVGATSTVESTQMFARVFSFCSFSLDLFVADRSSMSIRKSRSSETNELTKVSEFSKCQ